MTNVQTPAGVAQPAPTTPPMPTTDNPLPSRIGPSATPHAASDAPAEHQTDTTWSGPAGEVRCTCGAVYAGGSVRESSRLLAGHIARRARAAADAAPAAVVSAAAAGQPALIRIARTNMLRAISRECFAVDKDALPAPEAVAFVPHDGGGHAVDLEFDTVAEAEAWAVALNATRDARITVNRDMAGTLYRGYRAECTWRGFEVTLAAVERAAEQFRSPQVSGRWAGASLDEQVRLIEQAHAEAIKEDADREAVSA
ncbi:hypothetical protein [Micromonospora fulviviridis]|uniref:hypothetical protein n=1 Tax=Micromonospora fulviviridis TaxID=47860 RepID=UPI00379CCEB6